MLRNYGERILIFNMHDPATREAFSTARENTNGYVLVSEPVSIDLVEGVFDLDKGTWENFYNPKCRLDKAEEYGVNDAEKMCKYFSRVYQQRSCSFDDLEPNLRDSVISIGQHYMQNLRYPTGGTPRFMKADTPANVQRTKEVRKDVIIEIVEDVADQIDQKKKIKAKAMPKPDPPDLPAKSDPAKLQARTKPPPACATEPPPKAPPKGFESYASTDTTVKVKEEPKSSTDTTVKKHKAAPATDTTVKKESSNKISLTPRGTSSTPATSSATPIPPAVHLLRKFQNHLRIYQGNLNVQLVNHFQHHHQHQFTENNHHDPKSNVFQHRLLLRSVTILEVPTLRKNMNLCRDDGVKLLQMMSKLNASNIFIQF